MFRVKNEQGYALVSVLLVIVIFMILLLSFVGQSSNSISQNQVVEKNSQSVALAEMGISYYQTAVKNIYIASQTDVNNTVQTQISNDGVNRKSADYYAQSAATLMKNKIQTGLSNIPTQKQVAPNASFKLIYQNFDNNIILRVQGTENGKSTTLSTEMTLSPIVSGLTGTGGSSTGISITLNGVISGFNSILQPLNLNIACNNPASINIYTTCQKVFLSSAKTYSENNIGGGTIQNPYIIFSTAALTLSGNANNLSFVQIHTDGVFTLGKNMNNASNVILEIKNTANSNPAANFGSQLRLDASQFYVNGNMNIDGQFDLDTNSFVLVNGNATISKHLNVTVGSTLCVNGNLTASKINATGSLVVYGSINGKATNTSLQDFQQKCSSSTPQTPTFTWGNQLSNTVNYEY